MRAQALVCGAALVAACARAQNNSQPASESSAGTARVFDVREILAGAAAVDAAVSVRGTCIRMDEKAAFGPSPTSRSDWQMRDGVQPESAIWVVGERPADCGYDKGSAAPVTIRALVARDTVRQMSGAGVARWYLRRVRGE